MKLDKKIAKLLEEHGIVSIMEQLVAQSGLTNVMMQVSNRLVYKGSGKDKAEAKKWTKRAKVVHGVIDEIEAEHAGEATQQAQA